MTTILAMLISWAAWLYLTPPLRALVRLLPVPEPYFGFLLVISSSWSMVLMVFLTSRLLLKKRFPTLVSPLWSHVRFLIPFCSYLLCALASLSIQKMLHPADYTPLHPDPATWLGFALLAIVLHFFQVLGEEGLMRIYPASLLKDQKLASSLLTMLLFTLPHLGNTEVRSGRTVLVILTYAAFGFWATWESQSEGGYEFALATHLANNLSVTLFFGYEATPLKGYPFFRSHTPSGSLWELGTVLFCLLFSSLSTRWVLQYHRTHEKDHTHQAENPS